MSITPAILRCRGAQRIAEEPDEQPIRTGAKGTREQEDRIVAG